MRELYGLCHEVLLPRIQRLQGFPGAAVKHFVNQLVPQLPHAFSALDEDTELQRHIMDQLQERYTRLQPEMERWLGEHDDRLQETPPPHP